MRRDVNSITSAEMVSLASGTASKSASGGNSESGISIKRGCCFSRCTRTLWAITGSLRTICTGVIISIRPRTSSTNSSRSTLACSPTLRSTSLSRRSRKRRKLSSIKRPTCSANVSQEKCRKSDKPAHKANSKMRVEPVKPTAICKGSPINSPKTPPGGLGKAIVKECKRIDSKPILASKVRPKPSQRSSKESGFASGSEGIGVLHNSFQPENTRLPNNATHQKAEMPNT